MFYIISPTFTFKKEKYFFIAGGFVRATLHENIANYKNVQVLEDQEINVKLHKMQTFYQLLLNHATVTMKSTIPERVIDDIRQLGDLDLEIDNYPAYIEAFLQSLSEVEVFEFLGLAVKEVDDRFTIQYILGENVQQLRGKSFYIGEGLLGKSAILGESFYWSKEREMQRTEFFSRYGIFPNHLFGCVMKTTNEVDMIVFGGNFQEVGINDSLLTIIQCVFRLINQRKNLSAKLLDSYYIQSIFSSWLDLMDVAQQTDNEKFIAYKILDFCQTMNHGEFACCTSSNGDYIERGQKNGALLELHKRTLAHIAYTHTSSVWIEQQCIHFYIDFNTSGHALFTIAFDQHANLQQAAYVLEMVEQLLRRYKLDKEAQTQLSIFDILHTSLQELNEKKYEISVLALQIVMKISTTLKLPKEIEERLYRLSKVLPYSRNYLIQHIKGTKEWQLFVRAEELLHVQEVRPVDIDVQIFAFIYQILYQRDTKTAMPFLNHELYELLMNSYEMVMYDLKKAKKEHHQTSSKAIEEMADLKKVISTLSLTFREEEILYLMLEGLNNQEVGQYLNISVHTVKNHVTSIFKKLNVSDRIQAMAKIYRIKYEV